MSALIFALTYMYVDKSNAIEGTYVSEEISTYKSFTFRGKTTVIIKDGLIGFDFATTYKRDGNLIIIKTDKSDLLLTIHDNNTLIGEGFAKGTYEKVIEDSSGS